MRRGHFRRLRVYFQLHRVFRIATLYEVIKSYRHKGLRAFAETGSKSGIQPKHGERLRRLMTALDVAEQPKDMAAPGNKLHALSGHQ